MPSLINYIEFYGTPGGPSLDDVMTRLDQDNQHAGKNLTIFERPVAAALSTAVQCNKPVIFEAICEHAGDEDKAIFWKNFVTHARYLKPEIFPIVVPKFADFANRPLLDTTTLPLNHAVDFYIQTGQPAFVETLLAAGADPNLAPHAIEQSAYQKLQAYLDNGIPEHILQDCDERRNKMPEEEYTSLCTARCKTLKEILDAAMAQTPSSAVKSPKTKRKTPLSPTPE